MTREDLLEEAIKLSTRYSNVCLEWCTGLGKSRAALEIADALNDETPGIKILLVVAEVAHKSNWTLEVDKWNKKHLLSNMSIDCYASLKNHKDKSYDLLILDEAHHGCTDIRLDILETISVKHVLLLSATTGENLLFELRQIYGEFHSSIVPLKVAIHHGLIPEPKVFLIPLKLDTKYRVYTIVEERGLKNKMITIKCGLEDRWKYLRDKENYPNIRLEMLATQFEKNLHLTVTMDYYNRMFVSKRTQYFKNKWLQLGSERKRFLGECKTEMVQILLKKLSKYRLVCFCASVSQAETLGGRNAIYSENPKSLEVIDKFNAKKIRSIFAVDMIKEGQNLKDIQAGIIIQLGNQERDFIQKMGRALRAEDPLQFIFYYENTRDVDFLNNTVLPNIDSQYLYTVEDLTDIEI